MVGEAYVRVTADTTQMRRALHRAARDSERDMQAFQALIDDVADSQISAVKKRLAGGLVDPKILTRWSKEFKNSSEAAENFRGVINSIRNDFSEMTAKQQKEHLAAINRWEKQAKAAESLAAAEKQRLADEKAALDAAKVRSAEQQRMLVAQQKFAEEGRRQLAKIALAEEKEVAARQQRMAAAQERFVAEARRVQQIELRDAIVHADRMNKAFDSIAEKYSLVFRKKSDGFIFNRSELTSLAAQFEHAGETAGEALARGVRSRVRSIEGAFDSIALRINRSGGFVGTILGKGSRNNFLNFFGSAIGGLVNILSVPFTLMSKLASGVSQLAEGFKVLRLGGASSMEALSALAARAAPAAAAGLVVLGVAIAATTIAIPALVSGLWLLIGALTALVGSISIGIIGGLLALGPAIVGLAAGLGAAVLVFRRMGEDGTKAAASLSRIKKAFADLGDSASEESDRVASQIEGTIVPAINGAKPVMRSLVTAFGEVMADLGRKVQNSEFQQRLAEWGQSLPRLFTDMGGAFNSLGTGLVSFFAGVLPVAERFASSFNGLMERFREWATSLEGQNQIKTWMDQAWTAANNLWGIVSNLAGAIGKIFTSGDANAGNDMLDTLSRKAEEFNKWLGSPDGKEKMKQFFSDARELADKLWEIIKNVGGTLKNLDTDQAREDFLAIVEGAKKMAEAIKTLSRAVEVLGKILFPVKTLIDAIVGGGSSKSKSSSTPSLDTKFPASDSWSKLTGGGLSQADEKEQQRRLDAMAAAVEKSQERVRAAFRQTERDTQNSTPGPKADWYEKSKADITAWSEHFGGVSSKTSTSMVETIGSWTQDTLGKIGEWASTGGQKVAEWFTGAETEASGGKSRLKPIFDGIPTDATTSLARLPLAIANPFTLGLTLAQIPLSLLPSNVSSELGRSGPAATGALASLPTLIGNPFTQAYGLAQGVLGLFPQVTQLSLSGVPGAAGRALSGLAGAIGGAFSAAYDTATRWLANIRAVVSSMLSLSSQASNIGRSTAGGRTAFATGGVVFGPTRALIGEAGPEMVVPLTRPLSLISPAVREVAAFAQGKTAMASGGIAGARSIIIQPGAIVVNSPNANPELVAESVLDRLASSFH